MDESTTFETTRTLAPRREASCMALDVSSVSPDWETPTHEVRSGHHRVPVAELAGDVDLGGQLDPVLNGVLGHQRGVVAAPAGHDAHLVDLAELVGARAAFRRAPARRAAPRRSSSVLATARGCSCISLDMKSS